MDKSLVKGLAIGAVVATGAGAAAGYKLIEHGPQYAEVVDVQPVMKTTRTPHEVCNEVVIAEQAPTRDPRRVTGTVVGAVVGGVLGNQIGDGSGQKLATVAGAAAGGYTGNRIQKRMQQGNTVERSEQRCTTVYDEQQTLEGYDVHYRLDGQEGEVRMEFDPGPRIPVQDGQLVLTRPKPETQS